MKFTAVGDMIIQKRIYDGFEGIAELAPFIKQGDARFFNLETTLNREGEACASQFSGGTYLRTDPAVLGDILRFGFNMTSFNNNHALDFGYRGLLRTWETVNASGLVHAGVGRNLAEAAAPRFLETKNGRVALISVNTNFNPSMLAGEQTPRVPGRPGVNGLRIESRIELPKKDLEAIRRIAKETGINVGAEITRKEGYIAELPENEAEFGDYRFVEGECSRVVSHVSATDMARVEKAIAEATFQADYVLISIHSHQLSGTAKENPSDFLIEFAHRCIDVGANAVIGHGPHLLRPIEIYRDCPIFYSLGDFTLQLYDIEFAPEEFYAKFGLTSASTVWELLKKRSKNFTVGLMTDPRMFRTVIPFWQTEGKRLTSLTLMPVEMKMDGNRSELGLPRRTDGEEIAAYLAEMCRPFNTDVRLQSDGLIHCAW